LLEKEKAVENKTVTKMIQMANQQGYRSWNLIDGTQVHVEEIRDHLHADQFLILDPKETSTNLEGLVNASRTWLRIQGDAFDSLQTMLDRAGGRQVCVCALRVRRLFEPCVGLIELNVQSTLSLCGITIIVRSRVALSLCFELIPLRSLLKGNVIFI
jgi:hypothetical protein